MPLDKDALFDFLKVLNGILNARITIVAAGGTAMTLLDLKTSTIDVDFTLPAKDKDLLEAQLGYERVESSRALQDWLDQLAQET